MKTIRIKGYFMELKIAKMNDAGQMELRDEVKFHPVARARKNSDILPDEVYADVVKGYSARNEMVVFKSIKCKEVKIEISESAIYKYGKVLEEDELVEDQLNLEDYEDTEENE